MSEHDLPGGEPIFDPAYWAGRLREARSGCLHHAVFRCPEERWRAIEARHRALLARVIGPGDSILDCGCGWGRLLELLPRHWEGLYYGVDLSPDFVDMAKSKYGAEHDLLGFPRYHFAVGDLRDLSEYKWSGMDWAVFVSVRPMIRRHMGGAVWDAVEAEARSVARRLLFLEYDPDDPGSVE
jgi:SAM-dependent methyltransferase